MKSKFLSVYAGKIYAWDVVNEAFTDYGPDVRSSIWYDSPGIGFAGQGTKYIEQAFIWARAADPAALLFYNDYLNEGICNKSNAIYNMVADFKARGVPIDGVGFQMHIRPPENFDTFEANIARFVALGVQVHITELDVALPVDASGVATAAALQAQAETYRTVASICVNSGVTLLQTWGFTDVHSWVPAYLPGMGAALPFDLNYVAKPAYDALLDCLTSQAPTYVTAFNQNQSLVINWTPAWGATSYKIKRSTASGGPYTTIATGVTTTGYIDTNVDNFTTYYYVVSAVNASGEPASRELKTTVFYAGSVCELTPLCAPGMRLDVLGGGGTDGVNVQILTANGGNAQRWKLVDAENGIFGLAPLCAPGMRLDVCGASPTDGVNAHIWTAVYGNYAQRWKLVEAGDGTFGLEPQCAPESRLDVAGAGNTDGVNVRIWTLIYGYNAQRWTLTSCIPSPWKSRDIGTVAATGSASYSSSSGVWTVVGSGVDIGGTADEFRYAYQSSSSDCSMVAKVTSVQNTSTSAKAGVMIRESVAAGSRYAGVFVTPGTGITFRRRTSTGGSCSSTIKTGLTAPYWVKLTRTGNSFKAYYSSGGTSWTQLGSAQTITMATNATIGLAITSYLDGTLCTSTISNVTATP